MARKRGKDKAPAMQFYVNDYLTDENLNRCSLAAQGLWMRLLCIMFKCSKRGRLITDNKPWTVEETARAAGGSAPEASMLLKELIDTGTCRASMRRGILWNRRMVLDERTRRERARSGQMGGRSRPSKAQANAKLSASYVQANTVANGKLRPPPSSSSSSSGLDGQTEARAREKLSVGNPRENPNVLAFERQIGRNARPDELRDLADLRVRIESDPVMIGGKEADVDTLIQRAIQTLTPKVGIPIRWIRMVIGNARADGVWPGEMKREIARLNETPDPNDEATKIARNF